MQVLALGSARGGLSRAVAAAARLDSTPSRRRGCAFWAQF